jgi:hypothetical protein
VRRPTRAVPRMLSSLRSLMTILARGDIHPGRSTLTTAPPSTIAFIPPQRRRLLP